MALLHLLIIYLKISRLRRVSNAHFFRFALDYEFFALKTLDLTQG